VKVRQHVDDLSRLAGKLAVVLGVCPRSLTDHSLQRLVTQRSDTHQHDLLSLQASTVLTHCRL